MQKLILTILALALTPVGCWAETPKDSWENLKQLQQGHKVKVVDKQLKSWDGKVVSVSDEAITIRVKSNQQEIIVERPNVLRVTDLQRSKRARNALIGLAVGTGVAYLAIKYGSGEDALVGALVLFAGPGAAVGALVPSRPTIYRTRYMPSIASTVADSSPRR